MPAPALLSRLRSLVSGDAPTAPPTVPDAPSQPRRSTDLGPVLADGLTLDAWIDYAEGDAPPAERRITIRTIYGGRTPDGCAVPAMLRAWCHQRQDSRMFATSCIRALRATRFGAALARPDDIAMWLRCESGLLHARDAKRLAAMRRRAQEEMDGADPIPARARHWVEPTPVRIETTRDDEPLARRIEDLLVVSYEAGADGAPVLIYVARDADVRRGRAVRVAPAGAAATRLLMLQSPPGGTPVSDVPGWVARLPQRAGAG